MIKDERAERELNRIVGLALAEDRVRRDVTSKSVIPAAMTGRAVLQAKAAGIVSGLPVFSRVFLRVDRNLEVKLSKRDGDAVGPGDICATIEGRARSILAAERVALNFVCHLSGIATATARYVAEVRGLTAVIADTRKTMPGMRHLEKEAVRAGGGINHRFDLADGILIKDNHLAVLRAGGESLTEIVRRARSRAPSGIIVEVEVTSLAEAEEAAMAGADMLLLDNMTPAAVGEVALKLGKKVQLEASGGINLSNVRLFAEAGVHRISIGAITHSAASLDFSLELSSR